MRLYSPVDLTGNVNMVEKFVLGGTGTGDLPILSPTLQCTLTNNVCSPSSGVIQWAHSHDHLPIAIILRADFAERFVKMYQIFQL